MESSCQDRVYGLHSMSTLDLNVLSMAPNVLRLNCGVYDIGDYHGSAAAPACDAGQTKRQVCRVANNGLGQSRNLGECGLSLHHAPTHMYWVSRPPHATAARVRSLRLTGLRRARSRSQAGWPVGGPVAPTRHTARRRLPTLVDPEAKFMVTPVLAWSACPEFTEPVSLAEVADVRQVAIDDLSPTYGTGQRPGAARAFGKPAAPVSRLGQMTAAVIDVVSALLSGPTPNDSNNIHPEPPPDKG